MSDASDGTVPSTKRASLCGLPAELRNRIYELAIEESKETWVMPPLCRGTDYQLQLPTLIHVNQQLRAEVSPMWRAGTMLSVRNFDGAQYAETVEWLSTHGDAIMPHVKFIYFHCAGCSCSIRRGDASHYDTWDVPELNRGGSCYWLGYHAAKPGPYGYAITLSGMPAHDSGRCRALLAALQACLKIQIRGEPYTHLTKHGLLLLFQVFHTDPTSRRTFVRKH